MKVTKIVKFRTKHDPETINELYFDFETKYGTSKKIFDYLEENSNLDVIEEIKTCKKFRKVGFVTKDSEEIKELNFDIYEYKYVKDILDFLNSNYDLNFIEYIEKYEEEI